MAAPNRWQQVEIYATFLKLTGEIEILPPERLTDTVNRTGDFMEMRNAQAEPLSVSYPVISRAERTATIAKSSIILIAPVNGSPPPAGSQLWREKVASPVAINTQAFSMVADVHLDPRTTLREQIDRYRGDFIAVTSVSALWVAALTSETHALQRPFALLNPAAILSFSVR